MAVKSKSKSTPKEKEKKQTRHADKKEGQKKPLPKKQKEKPEEKHEEKVEEKHEKKAEKKQEERAEEQLRKILPPLDFSSIVLPFFTQALLELNETDKSTTTNSEENLKLTQRLIDLLNLLKEKTKGNLKSEEQIFLDNCLHQLRMAYMEKAKVIKL